ncbi:MAG: zinc transporter ZupT [Bacteroidales bacterium]|jgi:ZIP family zinc transporter|nr:zinc transporter ZupT [Bacteroidales bacterium]MDX9926358.1 zinc transporter ZupT [Bacteroidales bacterium]HNX82860.1 zinc transporter ZupT [Bacteroidales bacterium]HOC47146.1 zinc transporter ZupT [Bacteroidales bacterium]HPS96573.1 zinc transporter ZupT [Bacteroidales bacterium]
MDSSRLLFAFGITLFAGLATGIGGLIAFFAKRTKTTFLAFSLGFSAGVMIFISFTEILTGAGDIMRQNYDANTAAWLTFIAFVAGIGLSAAIDKILPSEGNPHELKRVEQMHPESRDPDKPECQGRKNQNRGGHDTGNQNRRGHSIRDRKLMRIGTFTAIAIGVHNFPEGIATFMSAMSDVTVGISIAVAVAIHNVPEGIAVSVPVYYATGSRRKALAWSVLSGFSEPIGALAGYFILTLFNTGISLGYVFAMVAGIMVYISFDELLPAAHKYGKHHVAIYGLISGMIMIGISLILLG